MPSWNGNGLRAVLVAFVAFVAFVALSIIFLR